MSTPGACHLVVFLGAAGLTFIIASPGFAHATPFDREMSAMYCAPYNSDDQWGSYGVSNLSVSSSKYYACSVPNDSQRNLTQVTTSGTPIYVYGSAVGTEAVRIWACRNYYTTTGGACGTETNNGTTTGPITLTPSASTWLGASSEYDMPYLYAELGQCLRFNGQCIGFNILRGYKVVYQDL